MKRLFLVTGCLIVSIRAFAQTVSVKDGNIQFTDKAGTTTALTAGGRDSDPVLAPDSKWVVFIRKIEGKKIATGSDEMDPTELWQVRVDGKEPTMLLRCRDAKGDQDHVLAAFQALQFSTNGKLVYFISPQWATSGAVHVGSARRGRHGHVDCLLVQQHRYFIAGGAYNWYWLFRTDGKEIGPVGEDTSTFEATYGNE